MFRISIAAAFAYCAFTLVLPLALQREHEQSRFRVAERADELTTPLLRVCARAARNARWSAAALVQYSSAAERLSAKARVRFKIREGTDLLLILDEGLRLGWDRSAALPPVPGNVHRS